jgi:hypothetical protein
MDFITYGQSAVINFKTEQSSFLKQNKNQSPSNLKAVSVNFKTV